MRWSSKSRQCEGLPSTAHPQQQQLKRPAADPQKIYAAFSRQAPRYGGAFATLAEPQLEVAYYLDTYFHFAGGYRSPHYSERDCQPNRFLAHGPFLLDQSPGQQ